MERTKLQSVVLFDEEELKQRQAKYDTVKHIRLSEIATDIRKSRGYADYIVRGKLNDDVEVNVLELAMIIDSGYSWFGGYSTIHSDRTFEVKIYTD